MIFVLNQIKYSKGDCGFGTVKIVPVSSDSCLAVGHNSITKIALQ